MADPIVETTDANGEATFTLDDYERDHDTYTATISKTNYFTQTLTFEATKDEEIDIVLESLPILTLTVTDGENPISGAVVTIGTDEETSDENGEVEFTLEYGDYTASITAEGYVTATEELSFRSNHKNFTVTLTSSGGGTGTVTVTCQYDFEGETSTYFDTLKVALSTHDTFDWEDSESEVEYLIGYADSVGDTETGTLTLIREETTDIPFGSYYLYARGQNFDYEPVEYSGTLTVDGDEEVTITLTPVDNGGEGG